MRHLIMAAMIGLATMHGSAHNQTVRSCADHLVTAIDNDRPFAPVLRHDCWQTELAPAATRGSTRGAAH